METHRTDEIKDLKACLSDLITVLALPAIWSIHEPIPNCQYAARSAGGHAAPGLLLCSVR